MQGDVYVHLSKDRKFAVVGALKPGEQVTVLEQVDLLIEPGLATVNDSFEHNLLNLLPGTEVHVLQYWEINYYHAWYDGKEVEGGLPIEYPGAFTVRKRPLVEQWVKVNAPNTPYRTGWALIK